MGVFYVADKTGNQVKFKIAGESPTDEEYARIDAHLGIEPPPPPEPVNNMNPFMAGLRGAGADTLSGIALGLENSGAPETADYVQGGAKEIRDYVDQNYKPRVSSIEQIKGIGDIPNYAYNLAGSSAGYLVAPLAGAAAAAFLAPAAATAAIGAGAAGLTGAALTVAETAALGANIAAATGFVLADFPQYLGGTTQRWLDEHPGTSLKDVPTGQVALSAAGQTALDLVTPEAFGVLGKIAGLVGSKATAPLVKAAATKTWTAWLAKVSPRTIAAMLTEAGTETAQQAMEIYAANPDKIRNLPPDVQMELLNSFIGGGLMGGALGTIGGGHAGAEAAKLKGLDAKVGPTASAKGERLKAVQAKNAGQDKAEQAEIAAALNEAAGHQKDFAVADEAVRKADKMIGNLDTNTPATTQAAKAVEPASSKPTTAPVFNIGDLVTAETEGQQVTTQPAKVVAVKSKGGFAQYKIEGQPTWFTADKLFKQPEAPAPSALPEPAESFTPKTTSPRIPTNTNAQNITEPEQEVKPVGESESAFSRRSQKAEEQVGSPPYRVLTTDGKERVHPTIEAARKQAAELSKKAPEIPVTVTDKDGLVITAPEAEAAARASKPEAVDPVDNPPVVNESQQAPDQVVPPQTREGLKAMRALAEEAKVKAALGVSDASGKFQVLKRNAEAREAGKEVKRTAALHALTAMLKGFGLGRVALVIENTLSETGPKGFTAEGKYLEGVITIAEDIFDPSMTQDEYIKAMADVMHHEMLHYMRAANLFHPREWRALVKYVSNTKVFKDGKVQPFTYVDQASSQYQVSDLTKKDRPAQIDLIEEEAVAEALRDYMAGRIAPPEMPKTLFRRILNVFKSFFGYNKARAVNVMERIRTGKFSDANRGALPEGSVPMNSAVQDVMDGEVRPKKWQINPSSMYSRKAKFSQTPIAPKGQREVVIDADNKRMRRLVSQNMYSTDLPETSIKELVQNSWDAIKAAYNTGVLNYGEGMIGVGFYPDQNVIQMVDNGIGMTDEIIEKSFIVPAGTNKKDLKPGQHSGGLGLAKLAFMYGAERIRCLTIRDGLMAVMDMTGEELSAEKPKVIITTVANPYKEVTHGTFIELKLPDTAKDRTTGLMAPMRKVSAKSDVPFFAYPLLGDVGMREISDRYEVNKYKLAERREITEKNPAVSGNFGQGLKLLMDVNQHPKILRMGDFNGIHIGENRLHPDWGVYGLIRPSSVYLNTRKLTTAKFNWGHIDIYIDFDNPSKYHANVVSLSSGVFQFKDDKVTKNQEGAAYPFPVVLDVKSTVEAGEDNYPFTNERQAWRGGVKNDIEALHSFLRRVAHEREGAVSIGKFAEPKIITNGTAVDAGINDAVVAAANALRGKSTIGALSLGETIDVQAGTVESLGVVIAKAGQVDFGYDPADIAKAEVGGETLAKMLDKAVYFSNLEGDVVDIAANIITKENWDYSSTVPHKEVLANARKSVYDFIEQYAKLLLDFKTLFQTYSDVSTASKVGDVVVAVLLDTKLHGLNIRLPFKGIFINPLTRIDRLTGSGNLRAHALSVWETLIHEFAHEAQRNHYDTFVSEFHAISEHIANNAYSEMMAWQDRLVNLLADKSVEYEALGTSYGKTKNRPDALVGDNITQSVSGEKLDRAIPGRSRASEVRGDSGPSKPAQGPLAEGPSINPEIVRTYARRDDGGPSIIGREGGPTLDQIANAPGPRASAKFARVLNFNTISPTLKGIEGMNVAADTGSEWVKRLTNLVLKKPDLFKMEELKDTGILDWLNSRPNEKIKKEQVVEQFTNSSVNMALARSEVKMIDVAMEPDSSVWEGDDLDFFIKGHGIWTRAEAAVIRAEIDHIAYSESEAAVGRKYKQPQYQVVSAPHFKEGTWEVMRFDKAALPRKPKEHLKYGHYSDQKAAQEDADIKNKAHEPVVRDLARREAYEKYKNPETFDKLIEGMKMDGRFQGIAPLSQWEPQFTAPGDTNTYRVIAFTYPNTPDTFSLKPEHFSPYAENKVFAHARIKTRYMLLDDVYTKVFHIEEIQSDWHQAGTKFGYRNQASENAIDANAKKVIALRNHPDTIAAQNKFDKADYSAENARSVLQTAEIASRLDPLNPDFIRARADAQILINETAEEYETAGRELLKVQRDIGLSKAMDDAVSLLKSRDIPDAPYKSSWMELVFKGLLEEAVRTGHQKITWTPGKIHAQRYDVGDMSRGVMLVENLPGSKSPYTLRTWKISKNAKGDISTDFDEAGDKDTPVSGLAELAPLIGYGLAKRLMDAPGVMAKFINPKDPLIIAGRKSSRDGMELLYDSKFPKAINKVLKDVFETGQDGTLIPNQVVWRDTKLRDDWLKPNKKGFFKLGMKYDGPLIVGPETSLTLGFLDITGEAIKAYALGPKGRYSKINNGAIDSNSMAEFEKAYGITPTGFPHVKRGDKDRIRQIANMPGPRAAAKFAKIVMDDVPPRFIQDGWYSSAHEAVRLDPGARRGVKTRTGAEWLAFFKATPSVKKDELRDMGLDRFLNDMAADQISRGEMLDQIQQAMINIAVVDLGENDGGMDAHENEIDNYIAMGESDYVDNEMNDFEEPFEVDSVEETRELEDGTEEAYQVWNVVHVRMRRGRGQIEETFETEDEANEDAESRNDSARDSARERASEDYYNNVDRAEVYEEMIRNGDIEADSVPHEDYTIPGDTDTYRIHMFTMPGWSTSQHGQHFDDRVNDPILGHMRTKIRHLLIKGKKVTVLHIEELQSDVHRKGRDNGYKDPDWQARVAAVEKNLAEAQADPAYVAAEKRSDDAGTLLNQAESRNRSAVMNYQDARRFRLKEYGDEASVQVDEAEHKFPDDEKEAEIRKQYDQAQEDMERFREDYSVAYTKWTMLKDLEVNPLSEALSQLRNAVARTPFRDQWQTLMIKKALQMAVDAGGIDYVMWTPGGVQAMRYNSGFYANKFEIKLVMTPGGTSATGVTDQNSIRLKLIATPDAGNNYSTTSSHEIPLIYSKDSTPDDKTLKLNDAAMIEKLDALVNNREYAKKLYDQVANLINPYQTDAENIGRKESFSLDDLGKEHAVFRGTGFVNAYDRVSVKEMNKDLAKIVSPDGAKDKSPPRVEYLETSIDGELRGPRPRPFPAIAVDERIKNSRKTGHPLWSRIRYSQYDPKYLATANAANLNRTTIDRVRTQMVYGAAANIVSNGLRKVKLDEGRVISAQKYADKFIQMFGDRMLPVGRLVDSLRAAGKTITDQFDSYLNFELLRSLTGNDMTLAGENFYEPLMASVAGLSAKEADFASLGGVAPEFADFARDADNANMGLAQAYIAARHAPERNQLVAHRDPTTFEDDGVTVRHQGNEKGSGFSTDQALATLDWFRARPDFAAIQAMAVKFDALIEETNRIRRKFFLTPDFRIVGPGDDFIRAGMPNGYDSYAPMRGRLEEDIDGDPNNPIERELMKESETIRVGRGTKIRGREDPSVLGRDQPPPALIFEHAVMQNMQAIIRGRKNEVTGSLISLLRTNAGTVIDYNHQSVNIDKVAKIVKATPLKRILSNGIVKVIADPLYKNDPRYLVGKVLATDMDPEATPGQVVEVAIDIHDDNLRHALTDANGFGSETQSRIISAVGTVTQTMAKLATQWNPLFLLTNFPRDLGAAQINLSQYEIQGLNAAVLKGVRHAWRATHLAQKHRGLKYLIKGEETARINYTDKDGNNWSEWGDRFRAAGGDITFWGLTDITDMRKQMNDFISRDTTNIKRGWAAFKRLGEFVEAHNKAVESAVRLSTFKALIDAGLTEAMAAQGAKNVTVNFDKGGSAKGFMGALYMFYNANVQGTMVLASAMARSKKVRRVMGGIVAAGVMQDLIMSMMAGDDDDGQNLYDNIPNHVLEHKLIFLDPTGTSATGYLSIPLPYGANAFFNMGRATARFLRGRYTVGEAINTGLGTFTNAFNPMGGEASLLATAAPTLLDPLVELSLNRDWSGKPVYKEADPYTPAPPISQRHWNNTSPVSIAVSDFMHSLTGGTDMFPGAVEISPDILDYLLTYYTSGVGQMVKQATNFGVNTIPDMLSGEEVSIRDIPIASKFFGNITSAENDQKFFEIREQVFRARKEFEDAVKAGQPEDIKAAMEAHKNLLHINGQTKALSNARSAISTTIKKIRANPRIPEDRKTQLIKPLKERQQTIEKNLIRVYNTRVRDAAE